MDCVQNPLVPNNSVFSVSTASQNSEKTSEESSLFSQKFADQLEKESQKWSNSCSIDGNNLGVRCTRFLLKYGAPFFGSPINQEESYLVNRIRPNRSQFQLLKQSKGYRLSILLSLYFYLYLGVTTYFNYKYDWHNYKLKQLNNGEASSVQKATSKDKDFGHYSAITINEGSGDKAIELFKLEKLVQEDRAALKSIGAPYLDSAPFYFECVLLFSLLPISIFPSSLLLFNFIRPFNFGLIRTIVDSNREQSIINQLMLSVVREFVMSSKNYVRACTQTASSEAHDRTREISHSQKDGRNKGELNKGKEERTELTTCSSNDEALSSERGFNSDFERLVNWLDLENDDSRKFLARNLTSNQNQTVRQLKGLLLSGSFQPKNRANNKWVEFIAVWFGPVLVFYLMATNIMAVALMYSISSPLFSASSNATKIKQNQSMDKFAAFNYSLVNFYGCAPIGFYSTLLAANILDQCYYLRKLIRLAKECAKKNHQELQLLDQCRLDCSSRRVQGNTFSTANKQATPTREQRIQWPRAKLVSMAAKQHGSEINKNILLCFLNLKLFMCQFKAITGLLSFFVSRGFELLFALPVATFFHAPFLEARHLKLSAYCFWNVIFWSTLCSAPICYLNCRLNELHKHLFGLIAQSMRMNEHEFCPCDMVNAHLVWLIKKELDYPEIRLHEYSIKCFGSPVSYTFVLRAFFWYGILTMAFVYAEEIKARSGSDLLTLLFM